MRHLRARRTKAALKPRSVHVWWEALPLGLCVGWSALGCGDRAQLNFGRLNADDGGDIPLVAPSSPSTVSIGASQSPSVTDATASAALAPLTPDLGPVMGRVVDFWGHPVPQVQLDVDGRRTTSNQQGEFEVLQVSAVYDVSLVLRIDGEAQEMYAWTFEGLTGRALTLPVFRGLPPKRATVQIKSLDSNGTSAPCGVTAMGGRHGHDVFGLYPELRASVVWRSLEGINLDVQTLFWQPLVSGDCRVPGEFLGWQPRELSLLPGSEVVLKLTGPEGSRAVPSGAVRGVIQSNGAGAIATSIFLRFGDGATLPVLSSEVSGHGLDAFTYMAPVVDDTTLIVAASRGGIGAPDYAVAYEERRGVDDQEVELWLPTPPTPLEPAAAVSVPLDRAFIWQGDDVSLLAVTQDDAFVGQYVVTANGQATLRDLSHLGFGLQVDVPHRWTVEVHRAVSTVNEWLETPGGGLNPFSSDFNVPVGPPVGSGSFGRSTARTVVFASQ